MATSCQLFTAVTDEDSWPLMQPSHPTHLLVIHERVDAMSLDMHHVNSITALRPKHSSIPPVQEIIAMVVPDPISGNRVQCIDAIHIASLQAAVYRIME